jgi:hypothetical protein
MTWRVNALILFCTFWFLATFSAWRDANRNLRSVIVQRAVDTGQLASCNADLKVQTALATDRLERINFAQQNLNSTQQNLNACIGGSVEKLKQSQLALFATKMIPPTGGTAHFEQLLLMSNQPTSVEFRMHCSGDIRNVVAGLMNTTVMLSGRGGGRVSNRDWDISIGAPLLTPTTPLDVVVYYDESPEPSCSFSHMG